MPQRVPISPQWRMNFCWTAVRAVIISFISVYTENTIMKARCQVLKAPASSWVRVERGIDRKSARFHKTLQRMKNLVRKAGLTAVFLLAAGMLIFVGCFNLKPEM